MYLKMSFESLMKCKEDCSKCVGKCVVWCWRVEKGKRLYQSHFLWEDKEDKPMVVESCEQMKKTYKPCFDDEFSKLKTSGWRVFLLPSVDLASVLHGALDSGCPHSKLNDVLPGVDDFEI